MLDENDTLFDKAFAVFRKFFQINIKDREEELNQKLNEIIFSGEYEDDINDGSPINLGPHRKHAENIGEDFLTMFDKDIELYTQISNRIYKNSISNYRDRLDAKISKHNLEVSLRKGVQKTATARETEGAKQRSIEETAKTQEKKPSNRKRRSRIELEVITPKVVEAYQDLYDTGKYSWPEIFDKLAKNSQKLFGEKITSGSHQGIYNRRAKYLK